MLTRPRIARIAFAALLMMSVTALCGLMYADDETPAVHSDVPVSKGFKSAFAPNVSRAPLLDGLAASLPSTVDEIGAFSSSIPIHVPAYRGLVGDPNGDCLLG